MHKINKKRQEALKLLQLINNSGFEARIIGGAVRDQLLSIPSLDIDMLRTAKPDDLMKILTKEKIKFIPTGVEHGTITAVLKFGTYEITSLREDIETDGRHAKVKFEMIS